MGGGECFPIPGGKLAQVKKTNYKDIIKLPLLRRHNWTTSYTYKTQTIAQNNFRNLYKVTTLPYQSFQKNSK